MGPATPEDSVVERFFDLSTPPSRADVGLPDGETDVIYERDDLKDYPLRVTLPQGRTIEFPARLVTFDTRSAADPATAPPSAMDIHHYASGLDAGHDLMLVAARDFGLDTGQIETWYRQAKAASGPVPVKSLWLRGEVGYLRIDLQGRYQPTSSQTVVHYLLTWG